MNQNKKKILIIVFRLRVVSDPAERQPLPYNKINNALPIRKNIIGRKLRQKKMKYILGNINT